MPEHIAAMMERDRTLFQPADYGRNYATMCGYHPGAAWAFMMCGEQSPGLVFYTDAYDAE